MAMIRATVIDAIADFIADNYVGAVAILKEIGDGNLTPPYAVVRIGSGEQMYPGTYDIWDLNVIVGVFHDADATTAAAAEAAAASVFATLLDPAPLYTSSTETLVWSAFERAGSDAGLVENRWQHVAAFRAIVTPIA